MTHQARRSLERIDRQFDEFHTLIDLSARRVSRISDWSVGRHLDHLMKADRVILDRFDQPVDEPLPPLSTAGRVVLWTGWIPRGKGKSPAATLPAEPSVEELVNAIAEVRSLLHGAIDPLERLDDPQLIAKHHLFGGMSMAQWLRFIAVHHHHHAKIIRDVLRADPAQ